MPISFPSSPALGQVFQANGSAWSWNGSSWKSVDYSIRVFFSATPPTQAKPGDLWIQPGSRMAVYDGSTWNTLTRVDYNIVLNAPLQLYAAPNGQIIATNVTNAEPMHPSAATTVAYQFDSIDAAVTWVNTRVISPRQPITLNLLPKGTWWTSQAPINFDGCNGSNLEIKGQNAINWGSFEAARYPINVGNVVNPADRLAWRNSIRTVAMEQGIAVVENNSSYLFGLLCSGAIRKISNVLFLGPMDIATSGDPSSNVGLLLHGASVEIENCGFIGFNTCIRSVNSRLRITGTCLFGQGANGLVAFGSTVLSNSGSRVIADHLSTSALTLRNSHVSLDTLRMRGSIDVRYNSSLEIASPGASTIISVVNAQFQSTINAISSSAGSKTYSPSVGSTGGNSGSFIL